MLRPYRSPRRNLVHVERPGLAGCSGHVGNPPAGEGEFGKRGVERDVGARERADETGFELGQASFFWRGRSVTSSGARPAVTHSAVMATSRTSSRLGSSNMMSVIISSRMARKPRAPVL